jgi:hypothetical protein
MKISFLAALAVMPIRSRAEVPFDQDSPDNISLRPSVVADTNIHLVVATGFHGTEDAIHNTAIFPTWHRWYLYQFETALRSLSGDCDLT